MDDHTDEHSETSHPADKTPAKVIAVKRMASRDLFVRAQGRLDEIAQTGRARINIAAAGGALGLEIERLVRRLQADIERTSDTVHLLDYPPAELTVYIDLAAYGLDLSDLSEQDKEEVRSIHSVSENVSTLLIEKMPPSAAQKDD